MRTAASRVLPRRWASAGRRCTGGWRSSGSSWSESRGEMRLATRITLVVVFIALASLGAAFGAIALGRFWMAGLVIVPLVIWAVHDLVSRITELHAVLGNALSAFRDGDFGLRLAVRGDRELAELKAMYNALADTVRDRKSTR